MNEYVYLIDLADKKSFRNSLYIWNFLSKLPPAKQVALIKE